MTTSRRVFKNSVWLLSANVVLRILSALVIVVLARKLGVEAFGQYSFALSFVGFFVVFTSFGFTNLLIRDVAKDKSLTGRYVNNILSIKIVFSAIALIILFFISLFIGKSESLLIVIYVFGIHLIVTGFSEILRSVFHAYELMEFDSITKIVEKGLWAVLLLLVIFNNLSLLNVALATLFSAILGLGITYLFVKARISSIRLEFDFKLWKKIIIAATPFALTGVFALINFRIDQVMLSFITNDVQVGIYSAAYKIIDILATVPGLLLTALYPVFSVLYHKNRRMFSRSFELSLRYVIILAIPVTIGVYLLSSNIIGLVYGPEYSGSVEVLKILIFISFFTFINTPLFVVLNAVGKQKVTMINTAFTAIVNVVMNLMLIPKYGIYGAAFSTIISEITFLILSYYQLRKMKVKLNLLSKAYKPLIAGIVMGLFVWYFISLSIFIIIPVAAIIYFIVLFLLKEFSKEDFDMVKNILERKTK